jgi:hypothetical protein
MLYRADWIVYKYGVAPALVYLNPLTIKQKLPFASISTLNIMPTPNHFPKNRNFAIFKSLGIC